MAHATRTEVRGSRLEVLVEYYPLAPSNYSLMLEAC